MAAVVVGAGTAGCVIARRLVDAGMSVLLIEAGPGSASDSAATEAAPRRKLRYGRADRGYRTVAQTHAHDRKLQLSRGPVESVSSAAGTEVWARGHRDDYDTWAYLGNPHWSWADVEPVFRRVERMCGGLGGPYEDPAGGVGPGGPRDSGARYTPHPVHRSIVDAAIQLGIPFDDNYNDGTPDGVSFAQLTIRDGQTLTITDAYLAPVHDDPRLYVLRGARVLRLLFERDRCTGVDWERAGLVERVRAGVRVVLTAGAIGTATLLQRSGVGDPDVLRPLGIDVVAPLRGVGKNLQDHWLVPVILSTSRPIEPRRDLPACHSLLFWRSRDELAVPDLQPIHFAAPLFAEWMLGPAEGVTLMAGLVRPASRGRVTLASADPAVGPLIDPRTLSATADVEALVTAVQLCRDIAAQPALHKAWGAIELYPGTLGSTRDMVDDYVRESVITHHHQAGTCAMGSHEDATVDERLSVHGVEGLTVADASVMPTVTTGDTNAPVAVIAERAADFVACGAAGFGGLGRYAVARWPAQCERYPLVSALERRTL